MSHPTIYDAAGMSAKSVARLLVRRTSALAALRRELLAVALPSGVGDLPELEEPQAPTVRDCGWQVNNHNCLEMQAESRCGCVADLIVGELSSAELAELLAASDRYEAELREATRRRTAERDARLAAALEDQADPLHAIARRLEADRVVDEERQSWIEEHGSDRLRRCAAEGIEHDAIYRDERLALERPGWSWYDDVDGRTCEARNPPGETFALLDEARKTEPAAQLRYYTVVHLHADDFADVCPDADECPAYDVETYVAEAEFLGRAIVFGAPR